MRASYVMELIKDQLSDEYVDSVEILTDNDMEIIIDDTIYRISVEADIVA